LVGEYADRVVGIELDGCARWLEFGDLSVQCEIGAVLVMVVFVAVFCLFCLVLLERMFGELCQHLFGFIVLLGLVIGYWIVFLYEVVQVELDGVESKFAGDLFYV